MTNFRLYGQGSPDVVLVHGGPGAPGTLAPVARELSRTWSVLEALQTAVTLQGQINELHDTIIQNTAMPVTLLGHSWGAWLSLMLAFYHPGDVKQLLLVGSGPLEEKYVPDINRRRLEKLDDKNRKLLEEHLENINNPDVDQSALWDTIDSFIFITDNVDPAPSSYKEIESIPVDVAAFQPVWKEAADLRRSGTLLKMAAGLHCPITLIHGEQDPHPLSGVTEPLRQIGLEFQVFSLPRCGHNPWLEKQASQAFYRIVNTLLDANLP